MAEKTEAFIRLSMLNSRMKGFYDIWFLARTFPFELKILSAAPQATFNSLAAPADFGTVK